MLPCLGEFRRNDNSHFICDLPPIWEHGSAQMILGEHVDSLMKALESRAGGGE